MTMQNNIDIFGRTLRRNVLQTKLQTAADKIDNQRPLGIAVAISEHQRDRRTDRAQLIKNSLRANIAKMPDFVGIFRQSRQLLRKLVVRVGQNKNFCHVELSRDISYCLTTDLILAQRSQRSQSPPFLNFVVILCVLCARH